MKHLAEDMRRLGITIIIVAVIIALGAWLEHSTGFMRNTLTFSSPKSLEESPVPSAAPSVTPAA